MAAVDYGTADGKVDLTRSGYPLDEEGRFLRRAHGLSEGRRDRIGRRVRSRISPKFKKLSSGGDVGPRMKNSTLPLRETIAKLQLQV